MLPARRAKRAEPLLCRFCKHPTSGFARQGLCCVHVQPSNSLGLVSTFWGNEVLDGNASPFVIQIPQLDATKPPSHLCGFLVPFKLAIECLSGHQWKFAAMKGDCPHSGQARSRR